MATEQDHDLNELLYDLRAYRDTRRPVMLSHGYLRSIVGAIESQQAELAAAREVIAAARDAAEADVNRYLYPHLLGALMTYDTLAQRGADGAED